jgi:hypothetical protein
VAAVAPETAVVAAAAGRGGGDGGDGAPCGGVMQGWVVLTYTQDGALPGNHCPTLGIPARPISTSLISMKYRFFDAFKGDDQVDRQYKRLMRTLFNVRAR